MNCPLQLPRPAYTCGANLRGGSMLLPFVLFIAHNLVLDTLQILEEEGVVTPGGVFRILPWWTHCGGLTIVAPICLSSEWSLSTSARDAALHARRCSPPG